jgi:hypothetical protein
VDLDALPAGAFSMVTALPGDSPTEMFSAASRLSPSRWARESTGIRTGAEPVHFVAIQQERVEI